MIGMTAVPGLVLTWEGMVAIAVGVVTMLTALGMMYRLKKSILKGVESYISRAVTDQLAPFVTNQADVLRYSITRAHAQYVDEGMIDKYTLQALEALYRDYHSMNQNGFVDTLMVEMRELPSRPPVIQLIKPVRNEEHGII